MLCTGETCRVALILFFRVGRRSFSFMDVFGTYTLADMGKSRLNQTQSSGSQNEAATETETARMFEN
jgi:hypothetical protein